MKAQYWLEASEGLLADLRIMRVTSDAADEFERLRRKVSFYVWLRSLTFERLIDMQRAHLYAKRRSVSREERSVLSLPDESVAELASRLLDVAADPQAGMVRDEIRARVRTALDRLSPEDREVLVLRHLEDLSVAETAGALRVKQSTVKMRALRALQKLRELLAD